MKKTNINVIVHNLTWIDLCLAMSKGRTLPRKIKYIEKILIYDEDKQEYKGENGRVFAPSLKQLTDRVEILEK